VNILGDHWVVVGVCRLAGERVARRSVVLRSLPTTVMIPNTSWPFPEGPASLRLAAWEKEPDVIVSLYEDKVELDLLAGQLSCACSGRLAPWGHARPRHSPSDLLPVVQACACLGWLGSVLVPMASLPMAATDRASAQLHVGADSIGRLSRCLHDGLRGDFRRLCTTDGYPSRRDHQSSALLY
jgi:hypothetical protein